MKTASPSYMERIVEFPLAHIKTKGDHLRALTLVASISGNESELDDDEREYFALLIDLIDMYEKRTVPAFEAPTPREALRYLMDVGELKQVDVCQGANIVKTNLSAFLSGSRPLSKEEIARLAVYFKVNPLLFVEADYFGGIPFRNVEIPSH
jgi:antitoxin component HigA of HigAB toxin-antitoxin module